MHNTLITTTTRAAATRVRHGFTLIELLVVIGIIEIGRANV